MKTTARPKYVVSLKKTASGWHWRVTSTRNGRILGWSGEPYARREHCRRMAKALFPGLSIVS